MSYIYHEDEIEIPLEEELYQNSTTTIVGFPWSPEVLTHKECILCNHPYANHRHYMNPNVGGAYRIFCSECNDLICS